MALDARSFFTQEPGCKIDPDDHVPQVLEKNLFVLSTAKKKTTIWHGIDLFLGMDQLCWLVTGDGIHEAYWLHHDEADKYLTFWLWWTSVICCGMRKWGPNASLFTGDSAKHGDHREKALNVLIQLSVQNCSTALRHSEYNETPDRKEYAAAPNKSTVQFWRSGSCCANAPQVKLSMPDLAANETLRLNITQICIVKKNTVVKTFSILECHDCDCEPSLDPPALATLSLSFFKQLMSRVCAGLQKSDIR